MLSKLSNGMVDLKHAIGAAVNGNVLTVTYSDGSTQPIDFGPWIENKIANIKTAIESWDAWIAKAGTNMVITYPESGKRGEALLWSITGGPPNGTFNITADNGDSGLGFTNVTLDAQGNRTGNSTPTMLGSTTVNFTFAGGGVVRKSFNCVENPSIPATYTPTVNYPATAVQNASFSWSISGGKPGTAVKVRALQPGLTSDETLNAQGGLSVMQIVSSYGVSEVTFTFDGGVVIKKTINIYPQKGTILSEYCSGDTLMRSIADGAGGQTETVVENNNVVKCGFSNPIDLSGIPRTLFSAVPGGASYCSLQLDPDGTWTTYEFLTPPGPAAQVTTRTGRYLREGTDATKYAVLAGLYSLSVNGVEGAYSSSWDHDFFRFTGRLVPCKNHDGFNNVPGVDDPILFFVDQTASIDYNPVVGTTIGKFDLIVMNIADSSIFQQIKWQATAANACMSVDTWVMTQQGDRLLPTLNVGEEVCAWDAPDLIDSSVAGWDAWTAPMDHSLFDTRQISTVVRNQRFTEQRSIKINGFHSTMYHRHLVVNNGRCMWKRADQVTTDDSFVTVDKTLMPITSIEIIEEPSDFMFLNVEELDTLIIRATDTYILTHNES